MKKRAEETSQDERLAHVEQLALGTLALALSKLVGESGMSQRKFASLLGVTEGRVSQLLHAESNPTVRSLARIAEVLGRELQIDFPPADTAATESDEEDVDDGCRNDESPWPGRLKLLPSVRAPGDTRIATMDEETPSLAA